MAPRRPLPRGRASSHWPAGRPYHRARREASGAAASSTSAVPCGAATAAAGTPTASAADVAAEVTRKSLRSMGMPAFRVRVGLVIRERCGPGAQRRAGRCLVLRLASGDAGQRQGDEDDRAVEGADPLGGDTAEGED